MILKLKPHSTEEKEVKPNIQKLNNFYKPSMQQFKSYKRDMKLSKSTKNDIDSL